MDKKRIKIGDTVRVCFDGHGLSGVVLAMPQATGDCWVIDSREEGLCYVQQFIYIIQHLPCGNL